MKLFHLVLSRISLALTVILALWAAFFYLAMVEEINDEVDDSLSDYAERLIVRSLSGDELPSENNGTNNQYYLYEVSKEYAQTYPHLSFHDEMVYITDKGETEPARVLTVIFETDEGQFMELVVYTPTIEKYDLRQAILGWIIFLYVVLLLMIVLLNAWVFHRNMKPLYNLLDWLDHYRLGHQNKPLENTTRITEFHKLNEVVLLSSQRSEQLYEQQKLFIGNASHEMQTPLAICRNRLEMLMEDESLTEKQLGELMKTHQTLENLTRMNKSLLLLCKIENGQFAENTSVCFDHLLERYLDDYQEVYAYRHITVEVENNASFCVQMNDSLASTLVSNLLKNAFVHNVDDGAIHIKVDSESFTISNTGEEPLDENRIFERFYQGKKKDGSTGLGLALVDSICKAAHLSIRYTYKDGYHVFKVSRE